jgi:large subunit ribosomal protein L25
MKTVVLKAAHREVRGKQVKALRRQGLIPAVMYGHKFAPINISLNDHDTTLALTGISSSTIVTIELDGEEHAALVREKQKDYVKNHILHVDFLIVSLTETLRAEVRVEVHGLSPAVKDFNAVIVTNINSIEVEALPRDLPERIVVDVSALKAIGDSILVRDLVISDKVKVLTSADEVVVVATGSAPEEVVETAVSELAEPELIERGKKEEEEEE